MSIVNWFRDLLKGTLTEKQFAAGLVAIVVLGCVVIAIAAEIK